MPKKQKKIEQPEEELSPKEPENELLNDSESLSEETEVDEPVDEGLVSEENPVTSELEVEEPEIVEPKVEELVVEEPEVKVKPVMNRPGWMDQSVWDGLNQDQREGICAGKSLEEVKSYVS